jgi:hypothetical protein
MGCDIHIYVEKKNNEKWEAIKGKNPYFCKWSKEEFVFEGWMYNGRNYNLFAILADVRNSYNVKPISTPRGLPTDVSEYVQKESEDWGCDGHSHNYYTFYEILNYDWDYNCVENDAFVSEEVYKQFKETGNPYPCCKGVSGGRTEIILNSEMDAIINGNSFRFNDKSYYTAIKWKETHREIASAFLNNISTFIKENNLSEKDLHDYRIVFWFDN